MLTWTLVVLFLSLIYWLTRKPSGLPPGRWGLPIIGYVPLYTNNTRKIISDLREQYGDIFTWKIGSHVFVGLCDYELIKTTFNRPECQGRPYLFSFDMVKYHENGDIRYDTDDQEIIKFNANLRQNIELVQGRIQILDLFPLLVKILPRFVLEKVFKVNVIYDNMEQFKNLMLETIEAHVKTLDLDNPKDYIDAYLIEIQKERGSHSTIFKEDYVNLVITLSDFFGAGSETTSSTIRWLIALLATHPEIQRKMQKEIDEVVPRDTLPSLQDKERLPYTEAVLLEVMRYSSFVPVGVLHATTEEIQVGKYRLPKNTAIFASARSCHRDRKYFERPEEFYPEHFLDKNGKVITKKDGFLPFSLGRRQCLGESLARMELFLFATCLFQKFTASPPEGDSISLEPDPFQPILSFIPPYEVVLTKRT
ncbi:cytochrome P450 2L1-like isoform X3 [Macrobrachium nipponense]|uniref:cytochrome P450 2L1-like isoform X3 n=1 Tax=Macrobrachium nipponense TaxID=159736 RepID=UPI0030C86C46